MGRNALNHKLKSLYLKGSNYEEKESVKSKDSSVENITRKKIRKDVRDLLNDEFGIDSEDSDSIVKQFFPEYPPKLSLKDIAGIEGIIKEIQEFIIRPLKHPEIYKMVGVSSPCGVLLQGPPGIGKSHLSLCIAGELGLPFFRISGTNLINGVSGSSEASLRKLFDCAIESSPCIIIIDEIDIVTPKREGGNREMERRIVSQFASCLDSISNKFVVVIGTTSRPDSIDPIIRRNGRMDREISMPMPDESARKSMLEVLCKNIRIDDSVDFEAISRITPGFVGADLKTLINESALIRINKIYCETKGIEGGKIEILENLTEHQELETNEVIDSISFGTICSNKSEDNASMTDLKDINFQYHENKNQNSDINIDIYTVTQNDILEALNKITPSSRREGFTTIPDISWDDVGALNDLRADLELRIISPIKNPHIYDKCGLEVPSGVLLYGPPGCGKTLLAKAIAKESSANFISIRGPELLNKYVGESEKAVRTVFERARASAPCIVFFDELDSLCATRSSEGNGTTERVVNQLLTEMDGVGERKKVFIVAATNRPDIIDPAIMRPGRLDKVIYVPLPNEEGRRDILLKVSKKTPLSKDIDFDVISKYTDGFSGADLSQLIREATLQALDKLRLQGDLIFTESGDIEHKMNSLSGIVNQELLLSVISRMKPSVKCEQIKFFENIKLGGTHKTKS
ncbi:hypothetical protein FG386_000898 [Cryptosporidium ryanae]|uniref:uncharacterized protein n=1 Tax=Cryptosporidium ryanae TaxID=515981 RepID=UPI00351AADD1|nr:hypothetical protein FG386_000898 [Cryptosporidium ryanae]